MSNPRNARKSAEAAETAPKADKVDHGDMLVKAVEVFVSDTSTVTTEADVTKLQDAYRAIPAAARGKASLVALKVSGARMGDILDIFNNLPAATTSRTKSEMSDSVKLSILFVSVQNALKALEGPDGIEIDTSGHESEVTEMTERVSKFLSSVKVGSTRSHKSTKMVDLVTDGSLPAGSVLVGPNDAKCVVLADGSVSAEVDGKTVSGSVSEIAGKFTGHSVNGWAFWLVDGAKLDTLRLS